MQIKVTEQGIFHMIIDNGILNKHGLSQVGLSKEQICRKLSKRGVRISDVYLMIISDSGEERVITKKESS